MDWVPAEYRGVLDRIKSGKQNDDGVKSWLIQEVFPMIADASRSGNNDVRMDLKDALLPGYVNMVTKICKHFNISCDYSEPDYGCHRAYDDSDELFPEALMKFSWVVSDTLVNNEQKLPTEKEGNWVLVYALLGELCNLNLRCMSDGTVRACEIKKQLDNIVNGGDDLEAVFEYHGIKSPRNGKPLLPRIPEIDMTEHIDI